MEIIKINVTHATETQMFWLKQLLENEIEEAKGAASNEEIFAAGSTEEEQIWQHNENKKENLEYAEMLEDALKQINDLQN